MGLCLGDLDQRDLARLRTELVEVIAARFAYPAYYDFRAGASRVRPTGAVRRQEISTFVQAIILEPIARLDVSAPEIRRFLEQVFLRYLELNPDLAREAVRRRAGSMRVAVPQAAAEVQRGLVAFAAGAPGNFGAPRPAISWAGTSSGGARGAPDGEHGARGTALLQAALTGQAQPEAESPPMLAPRAAIHEQRTAQPVAWSVPAAEAASTPWDSAPTHTRAGAAISESLPPWLMEPASNPSTAAPPPAPAIGRPSAFNPGAAAWSDPAREETAPLPAHLMQLNRSLFAGLETGSQSDIFGVDLDLGFSDQPTGPQPSVAATGADALLQEIPPDLIALYSEYLRDLQPGSAARAAGQVPADAQPDTAARDRQTSYARPTVVSARPPVAARGDAATAPASDPHTTDRLIFAQLRQQLDAYLRQTARTYGVRVRGIEPAAALAALRQSGVLDEADLRLAEGILGITERILAGQLASADDIRQAFMLYLLYHRRHVGV